MLPTLVVLAVLLTVFLIFTSVYTNLLWHRSIGFSDVYTTQLQAKVALFFVTFLPQFLSADPGSARTEALLMSGIFAVLFVAWFGLYVLVVERLGRWLRRPRVKAYIEQLTGLVLATVAVRLATAVH